MMLVKRFESFILYSENRRSKREKQLTIGGSVAGRRFLLTAVQPMISEVGTWESSPLTSGGRFGALGDWCLVGWPLGVGGEWRRMAANGGDRGRRLAAAVSQTATRRRKLRQLQTNKWL
jgi:hypothetical protein